MIGLAGYLAASMRAMSSGARACRAVRTRCSGDGDGVGAAVEQLAHAPPRPPPADRSPAGPRPAPGRRRADAERSRERVGGGDAAAGHALGRQGVGAPLERGAVPHLDHEVRRRASPPSATGSAPHGTRARRSSPSRAGKAGRRAAAGAPRASRPPDRSVPPARTAPPPPASAGDCARRAVGEPPRQHVEHGAGAVGRSVEPGHQHDARLGGQRRQRRFEGRDAAPGRREPDRTDAVYPSGPAPSRGVRRQRGPAAGCAWHPDGAQPGGTTAHSGAATGEHAHTGYPRSTGATLPI